MIGECTCEHVYQDRKYGKGKRVLNKKKAKDGSNARCTVCLKHSTQKE